MPSVSLNALRTFEAVASRLSFSKAAEALNVSAAAVSSQIRALEDRLHQPLFLRQGRQISLTEAGNKLLPGVKRGLSELRQAVEIVTQDSNEGVLNISMMPSFLQKWLMPRLVRFYSAEPNIDLRINADNTVVDFDQSDMHAAVRFGPGDWPELETLKLADDWILPVCSRQLLDDIGPFNSVKDLQKRELLFLESEMWEPWFRVMGKSTRDSRWSMLNDSISVLMAAEQGEGIALSRWSLVARDIKAGRLVRPVDAVVKSDWSTYFVAPPHYFQLPKVNSFRQWLLEQFREFELPECH